MEWPTDDVPILLIGFNRPEKTQRVFEAVRAAAPQRLYVAADGPRAGVPSDLDRCERTRQVLNEVNWPCQVQQLYQPANLGCKRGVEPAIDWSLRHEERGIILEDDCLPTLLLALTVGLMRALWGTANRKRGLLGPGVLPSLLAMQVVWFLTWAPGSEQGVVIGISLASAAWQGRMRHRLPAPRPNPTTARPLQVERTPTGRAGS
jgi:hypothetical protein